MLGIKGKDANGYFCNNRALKVPTSWNYNSDGDMDANYIIQMDQNLMF